MLKCELTRRNFLSGAASTTLAACAAPRLSAATALGAATESAGAGSQRLSLEQLQKWESLQYGMFIHFGITTFVQDGIPDSYAVQRNSPAMRYAPDRLDIDQWVSVARDAGMKYIVLTAKHIAGHCLWPSKHTDYTVANSTNKTNVVEEFCKACGKRGVLPGLYYSSWDNHNRFGSRTRSDMSGPWDQTLGFPKSQENLPPFTTSLYQGFQTAQVTELLTQFGPIAETWIDLPGELGRSYRTFLYHHIAALQPQTVIMMNSGLPDATEYNVTYAWPSDLVAMEGGVPSGNGPPKWRDIEGKKYYMPVEVCNPVGKLWFWMPHDKPRPDEALLKHLNACRTGGTNFLLNVPPDTHGLIPDDSIAALMRLQKNAGI
ncbi:MAG: alpha-L-fucosidase [Planctomycetes bacterium]|nr:alpha-L-fucosidase [Planctomycetota bacterium]MBU4400875.1 alpha-L-fucosidase [Planctomycetota bacterium]MCG2684737.1 alpha-L-fucosidase [Planctomycetales bacterium]